MAATEPAQSQRFYARLIFVFAVFCGLNAAAWAWGDQYVRVFLPIYQWSFERLTPYLEIQSMRIELENGERVVKVRARTAGVRQLDAGRLQAGVPISSSTLAGHALQHAIVVLTMIFIWPTRVWWEHGVFVAFSIPALIIVEALDIPLVLAGAMEDLVLSNFDPGKLPSSPLVQGMHFMNSGGRLAVSLVAAMLVVISWETILKRGLGIKLPGGNRNA